MSAPFCTSVWTPEVKSDSVDTLVSTIHLTLMSQGFIWGKHHFIRDGLGVLDNRHNLKTHELLSSPDLPSEGCLCLRFSNVPSSDSGLCLAEHWERESPIPKLPQVRSARLSSPRVGLQNSDACCGVPSERWPEGQWPHSYEVQPVPTSSKGGGWGTEGGCLGSGIRSLHQKRCQIESTTDWSAWL